MHNGGNDSHKRQSQLWDQIICQTKTGQIAKSRQKFFCEIDWSYLCLATVWQILNMKKHLQKPELCCNLAKRHPYLRWSWERTIDSIRWCYKNQIGIALRNQANWPRLSTILFLRLETLQSTLLKLFEQIFFLSNCSKQLVTPVNLTRIFFWQII